MERKSKGGDDDARPTLLSHLVKVEKKKTVTQPDVPWHEKLRALHLAEEEDDDGRRI